MLKLSVLRIFSLIIAGTLFMSGFSAQAQEINNMRGQRYCEVLYGKSKILTEQVHVYNTIGLNSCPENLWKKLSITDIKKQTNADFVRMNGPRFWVIDGLKDSSLVSTTIQSFGGIAMREAGVLKLHLVDRLAGSNPYTTHSVHRKTTWVYAAGKPIYELVDPRGPVYVMQSYSIEKNAQTAASLANLGSQLTLPKDWKFRTRVLATAAYLTPVNENAKVIQDDFLNTYQQETPGFTVK